MVLQPKPNQIKITSIQSWIDEFLIFANIYLTKYPNDTMGILGRCKLYVGGKLQPFIKLDRVWQAIVHVYFYPTAFNWCWNLYMSSQTLLATVSIASEILWLKFWGSCTKYKVQSKWLFEAYKNLQASISKYWPRIMIHFLYFIRSSNTNNIVLE